LMTARVEQEVSGGVALHHEDFAATYSLM
jgi:hypothetical protein